MEKAVQRQRGAYRPGTVKNRSSAARSLIDFAVDMDFDFTSPTPEELCAYIEALVSRPITPNAIKGHLSSLKAYFRNAGFSTTPFESVQVANAIRAVDIMVKHNPKIKLALHPELIAQILLVIDTYPNGKAVSLSIALMFSAFLRQSNLLAKTIKTFDHDRQITCADVTICDDLLRIDLKWTKTNQRFGESTVITASRMPQSVICPVSRYLETQPISTRESRLPLIRFEDGNPMTVNYVNKHWRKALAALDVIAPHMTLHRLRLSGASWANDQGVGSLDICQQGSWRSESFRAYVMRSGAKPNKVNECMSRIPK